MIRILIIDDEVPLLRNLTNYLNSFEDEFEVASATTGEQGLELLEQREFDVLLADVRLPGVDGIELLPLALKVRPHLRVIVMTAFGSADVRSMALRHGALRFLEKPLDLHKLRDLLLSMSESDDGWSGLMGGLNIFDLTQLMVMTHRSRGLRVHLDQEEGVLIFREGSLVHASYGEHSGPEAFYDMARWRGGRFVEISESEADAFPVNIELPTTHLMMEAARLDDEEKRAQEAVETRLSAARREKDHGVRQPPDEAADGPTIGKEGSLMAIRDLLEKFTPVQGFKAAGVFAPGGEMIESLTVGQIDIKTIGLYANNALLNAQKATDEMGMGRGSQINIQAPKAIVIMRCLNEATDFAATKAGKAHFHTVVLMEPEGNTAMANMILDTVVAGIADEMR